MANDTPLNLLRAKRLPRMVRWYDPGLLIRVGIRTAISSVFGQYADQRTLQAATDPSTEAEIKSRYDYSQPHADPDKSVVLDETGALWVDYLADTGDGFEATYTMAYLLAGDHLRVNDADNRSRMSLNAGHILIMGGDQCYPQATREGYKKRLTTPFNWAYDVPKAERKLFAIPGNHDWYDGLNAFDSLFCSSRDKLSQAKGEKIGGWQCHQSRSYWAMKLPHNWWIWGTDIQFSKFLDSAQVSYFQKMAEQVRPGDKLVLCIAEPSWLLADFGKDDEDENFFTITSIARQAGAEIVAVIAGDWHVYARYFAPNLGENGVHFITAGGGGAFLHPTHVLKNRISVQWPKQVEAAEPGREPHGGFGPPAPGWMKEKIEIDLKGKTAQNNGNGGVVERVGEVVQDVGKVAREAAHEVAKDVHAPPQVERALRGRAHATRQQDAKCYPGRGLSLMLSLGNLAFPFRNIWFALFIGFIYWLITWQFYALVTEYDISAGAIDTIGLKDAKGNIITFWDVYKYTPFYLIQGLLVSLWLAFMLAGLYAALVWYVDASGRSRLGGFFRKFSIGTLHFTAHVALMFALGLAFVQFHNRISPTLHAYAEAAWLGSAEDQRSMTGAVARKVLEPLSTERQADNRRYQEQQKASRGDMTTTRRAAPPAQVAPSTSNNIDPKGFRQIVGFVLYPLEMVILGGIAGGLLWGLYWVLTGIFLRMHAEDAFAALRIDGYKNFLRFKFEKDRLTIYPIGIDRIPDRNFWTARQGARSVPRHNPQLIAPRDIAVRLIERPIVIDAKHGGTS